jgi:uncharacterized protein (DUF1919 family)
VAWLTSPWLPLAAVMISGVKSQSRAEAVRKWGQRQNRVEREALASRGERSAVENRRRYEVRGNRFREHSLKRNCCCGPCA